MAEIAKPFGPDSLDDDNGPRRRFARQARHWPRVLAIAYAIDRACPTWLQPELLSKYEKMSACWHKRLQMKELEQQLADQDWLDIADNNLGPYNKKRKSREGGEGADIAKRGSVPQQL